MQPPKSDDPDDLSRQAKLGTYDSELENGIFNMILSLCHHKANTTDMETAKEQVANWLERITNALRQEERDTKLYGE